MKSLTSLLTIICIPFFVQAQTKISGTISSDKGVLIANANVTLKGTYDGTSSDSTGRFQFTTTETGSLKLFTSSVGFDTDSLVIHAAGAPILLNIRLREVATALNTVAISAGSFVAGDSKKGAVLSSIEIATTAGTRADLFEAMQTLPGAQANFSESGLFVRGGAAAETKTYFDGLLVKSPFNATIPNQSSRGRLSAFLFKGTSFSTGGYSAQYGQALSSALILESTDLPEKTTTGINFLSVGGGIDQNIRFKKSAITIGTYYYNLKPAYAVLKQRQDFVKAPEQIGGNFQYKAKTSSTGMFKFYASYSKTVLSLNQFNINTPGNTDFLSNNNSDVYLNTTYKEYLGDTWKIEAGASYNTDTDQGRMTVNGYRRTDHLLEGKGTVTHFFGRLSNVKFGAETYSTGRDESLNELSRDYTDQLSSAFAETDLFLSSNVVIRAGLRTEYSSYLRRSTLAPRTSIGLKTGTFSQVSMAYGRFYQSPEDEYLIRKPLDFEQADHYILKYEFNPAGRNFRIEGYYKDYDRLTRVSSNGLPENTGSGYAKGFDIFFRDKKSIDDVDYRISYSFLDTRRSMRDYPSTATPSFAAKHTLNAVYSKFFTGLHSQVGAAYTFASGRTYVNPNNPVYLGDKTKNYNNLSFTVSYLTHILKQFTVVYLNATNIAGFNNVYGYQYSNDGLTRRPVLPGSKRDVIVGLLMTIGDNTFVR